MEIYDLGDTGIDSAVLAALIAGRPCSGVKGALGVA